MDKKYNAIQTLKDLDLSRGTRTSLSSSSGKSTFSTQSKEDRYNEAFKKDFKSSPKKKSASPPKNEAGPKMKSASPPKKKKEETDSKNKIKNPLSGRLVSIEYYNKLVKSGKIKEGGAGVAKRESPVAKKESSPKPKSPPKLESPPERERESPQKFKRNLESKAGKFYTKAWFLVKNFKKEGIKNQPIHPKQRDILNVILTDIIKLLNENKGDEYEETEIPSLVSSILDRYAIMYNKHTVKKYIQPLLIGGEADYTTFEGQLNKLVDEIYDPPVSETSLISGSSSKSSSSGASFKTNSSYNSS